MSFWLVLGAGVSGLGAARYLRSRGHSVRVSEKSVLSPEKAAPFHALGVDLRDGGHDLSHLDGVVQVVLSPGLPPRHPLVVGARALNLPVLSEIDLALADYQGQVLAVTGTNGKSTTCAMLGHLLRRLDRSVEVGGNFGDPPTAMLAEGRRPDYLVLELSSYQLEQSQRVAPVAAVFTSFSHDHLARHGSLEAYFAAKWRIFARQSPGQIALLPEEVAKIAEGQGLRLPEGARVVDRATVDGLDLARYGITEVHNQLNATFALLALSQLFRQSAASLAPLLAGFRPLPHRCEPVGLIRGHPVINDSKSTNVESTLVALRSQRAPVVLMMGGQGKGEPYAPLLAESARIAALVTFGATGPVIARELSGQGFPVHDFPTLRTALAGISGILEKYPRAVLFSPGCASFDEFQNYEHRGEVFREGMTPLCDPSPPPRP